jgi:hypothetical protein
MIQNYFDSVKRIFGSLISNAESERSEGEATTLKNAEIVKWRYLLDKIRTYFEQNSDAEFCLVRLPQSTAHPPASQNWKAGKNSLHPNLLTFYPSAWVSPQKLFDGTAG